MKTDTFGARMKEYEAVTDIRLTRRSPIIIRLDGRSFHRVTRSMNLERPFDTKFRDVMAEVAIALCKEVQNTKLSYLQSDEISLLVIDYPEIEKQCWFDNRLGKMVSIAASKASVTFFKLTGVEVEFDVKVFNVPPLDVCNNFIWRQLDATRNSIQMYGQKYFTNKELEGKDNNIVQDMLFKEKAVNWNDEPIRFKRGSCIVKESIRLPVMNNKTNELSIIERSVWVEDQKAPIFTENRDYINRFVPELNGTL